MSLKGCMLLSLLIPGLALSQSNVSSGPLLQANGFQSSTASTRSSSENSVDTADQVSRSYFRSLYEKAMAYDPAYRSALADYEAARIQATATLFALAPEVRVSETFLENERTSRRTISLSQPIFSIDRIATFQESDARTAQAQANLKLREFDLVQRLLRALSDLIRGNEGLKTNAARIRTLENEVERTRLEMKLGKGTLTDMRDTQVRLDQAIATNWTLESKRAAAIATIEAMTGEPVNNKWLALVRKRKQVDLGTLEAARQSAVELNPGIIIAAGSERLAELAYLRARSAYLPQVAYSISRTEQGSSSFSSQGFTFNLPLQAGSLYGVGTAGANVKRAVAMRHQTEAQVRVDVQRFFSLVESGIRECNQRLEAISSAELSVEATEASFRGGVRTRIDVLNSIQTLFQVNEDYVNSVVNLGENFLGLNAQTAVTPVKAVEDLSRLFFR